MTRVVHSAPRCCHMREVAGSTPGLDFHLTKVTDSFQIRLTFATAEYASWEI
jgi:hypothetical protein